MSCNIGGRFGTTFTIGAGIAGDDCGFKSTVSVTKIARIDGFLFEILVGASLAHIPDLGFDILCFGGDF